MLLDRASSNESEAVRAEQIRQIGQVGGGGGGLTFRQSGTEQQRDSSLARRVKWKSCGTWDRIPSGDFCWGRGKVKVGADGCSLAMFLNGLGG